MGPSHRPLIRRLSLAAPITGNTLRTALTRGLTLGPAFTLGNAFTLSRTAILGRVVALNCVVVLSCAVALLTAPLEVSAAEAATPPAARLDGQGLGWRALQEADFVNVNGETGTWTWKGDEVHCTGQPVGVIRSQTEFKNFELSLEWRHLSDGGNSGVFVWTPAASLQDLAPGRLPHGIEVQVLDHGYTEQYRQQTGKAPDWFTTHGDVFPVGSSDMKPFPPVAPDGKRSFPRKNVSRGRNEWNHYYIRAINGEVRLWVNGEEVSGGTECQPAQGYLCLESEGAPVEFRHLRLRELP